MKGLQYSISILFTLFAFSLFAQNKKLDKANDLYRANNFSEAIPLFEQGLKKKDHLSSKTKLAYCYKALNQSDKAAALYAEVVQNPRARPEAFFDYGEVLMSEGKYEEARTMFNKFTELKPEDELGRLMAISCSEVHLIQPHFKGVVLKPFTQNSDFDDSAPVFINDQVVFSSDRPQGMKFLKQKSGSTGRDFVRIYSSTRNSDGTFEPAKPFDSRVNELNKNTGPISFSADGKTAIFTRNSNTANNRNMYPMQLFSASSSDGSKWKDVSALNINRASSNYMHPALSPDGNLLFFVSDKGNGMGGTDIFMSEKTDKGWSKARNLGIQINTVANEGFPFVDKNGRLYFSSKGHPGYGGFDLFYSEMDENGQWSKPVNLGKPINSSKDDISIYLFEDLQNGFFTSSRDGGDDDIFAFTTNSNAEEEDVELLAFEQQPTPLPKSSTTPNMPDAAEDPTETNEEVKPAPSYTSTVSDIDKKAVNGTMKEQTGDALDKTESVTTEESVASPEAQPAPAYSGVPSTSPVENVSTPAVSNPVMEKEMETQTTAITTNEGRPQTPDMDQASANAPTISTAAEDISKPIETETPTTSIPDPITAEIPITARPNPSVVGTSPVKKKEAQPENPVPPVSVETETIERQSSVPASPKIEETAIDMPAAKEAEMILTQDDVPVSPKPEDTLMDVPVDNETKPAVTTDIVQDEEPTSPVTKTNEPNVYEGEIVADQPELMNNPTPDYQRPSDVQPRFMYSYSDLNVAASNRRLALGQELELPEIKFPFNEFAHSIDGDMAAKLTELVNLLQAHPGMRIEVGGYTSSFGEDSVNKTLSRYRADAVINYLAAQGIDRGRLSARGYGESGLLNHCRNGVLCTRDQHMENQRMVIKVLAL